MNRSSVTQPSAVMLAFGLLATGCVAADSVPDGLEVSYLEVSDDETWTDLASRVVRCDDGAPDENVLTEVASYLRATNPAIDEAGLAARQLIAFDPDEIPTDCTTSVSGEEPAAAEVQLDAQDSARSSEATATDYQLAFSEAFDDPASLDRFQWQFHHGVSYEQSTFSWQGDHDDGCGKPSTTRTIEVTEDIVLFPDGMGDLDRYGNFVYWCAPGGDGTGHLMTSFNTEGYAQIAFAPDQSFDDVRKVCWDQNQTDLGARKWTQLVVVPESTFDENDRRLDYVSPTFQDGPGEGAVRLTDGVFLFEMIQGSTLLNFGQDGRMEDYSGFTNNDKVRRYSTCLADLGNDTIEIALEREDHTEIRTYNGSFPSGTVRVVLQDDNYNPPKAPGSVVDPFTWHWDNITIETA